MPFQSEAQRKFMYAKHPDIAARWESMTPKDHGLPKKLGKKHPTNPKSESNESPAPKRRKLPRNRSRVQTPAAEKGGPVTFQPGSFPGKMKGRHG